MAEQQRFDAAGGGNGRSGIWPASVAACSSGAGRTAGPGARSADGEPRTGGGRPPIGTCESLVRIRDDPCTLHAPRFHDPGAHVLEVEADVHAAEFRTDECGTRSPRSTSLSWQERFCFTRRPWRATLSTLGAHATRQDDQLDQITLDDGGAGFRGGLQDQGDWKNSHEPRSPTICNQDLRPAAGHHLGVNGRGPGRGVRAGAT